MDATLTDLLTRPVRGCYAADRDLIAALTRYAADPGRATADRLAALTYLEGTVYGTADYLATEADLADLAATEEDWI